MFIQLIQSQHVKERGRVYVVINNAARGLIRFADEGKDDRIVSRYDILPRSRFCYV